MNLKEKAKKKILMWIAGLIAPAIPFILIGLAVIVVIIMVFAPLTMAKESSESNRNNNEVGFFEKFDNFLNGNGWTSDEQAFFQIMQKKNLNCKQSTLVTATILYYYQFNLNDDLDYGEEPLDQVPENLEETQNNDTTNTQTNDDMYSDVPYGKLLPDLKRLVNKIVKGNNAYEKYVKEIFLKQYPYYELINGYDDEQARIDEIYEEIKQISYSIDCIGGAGNYNGGICSFDVGEGTATNLKVRPLRCGNIDGNYAPLENEELIDFEKYILGVVNQEVGAGAPLETMKAQAVAARSFALTRGAIMGGITGNITEENGEWVLSIRTCTSDQVYCDPDEGCWSDVTGGSITHANGLDASVHSGYDPSKKWSKAPIPEDSLLRQAVLETAGEVLVNSDDDVIESGYRSSDQNSWTVMANGGSDYYEILLKHYGDRATDIKSNCTLVNGAASGDFANWKQFDPQWKDIKLAEGTRGKKCNIRNIGCIGCTATSVAIQIARSNAQVNIENFNPGTFVEAMRQNSGFDSTGNILWEKVNTVATNFMCGSVGTQISLTGNKQNKANLILQQIERGKYIILNVKSGGHWVAVDRVDGENVYIFDPGITPTGAINLWDYHSPGSVIRMAMCWKTD